MFHILFLTLYMTQCPGILNKQNKFIVRSQAFAKSSTLASSGVKENVFPINMMLLLWTVFILNNNYFILFDYFIIPMMLWVDMLLRFLCCNWTLFCVLAGGTANFIIYLFMLIIMLLWLMLLSLGPDVFKANLFILSFTVHDVIEPWWVSGGHKGPGCYQAVTWV